MFNPLVPDLKEGHPLGGTVAPAAFEGGHRPSPREFADPEPLGGQASPRQPSMYPSPGK